MKTFEKISLLIFTIHYLVCEGGSLGNDIKKKKPWKGWLYFRFSLQNFLNKKKNGKTPNYK